MVDQAESSVPATGWGWYREPVTVSFTCTPNGSPLVGACPAPVTVTATGAAQEVSGTITAEDGGVATASVSVNLDRVVPQAIVTGVTSGQTYVTPPAIRAKARDLGSGVAWSRFKTHSLGKTTWYRLKVRDRAGNESLVKGWYKVNPAG